MLYIWKYVNKSCGGKNELHGSDFLLDFVIKLKNRFKVKYIFRKCFPKQIF